MKTNLKIAATFLLAFIALAYLNGAIQALAGGAS